MEKEHISRPLGPGLNLGKGSNGKDDHLDILKTLEFPLSDQTDALTEVVHYCQSKMHLHIYLKDKKIFTDKGTLCVLACNHSILACSMYVGIIFLLSNLQ